MPTDAQTGDRAKHFSARAGTLWQSLRLDSVRDQTIIAQAQLRVIPTKMSEFKDTIPAASGKVEFLYNPDNGGIATKISGFGFMAIYQVAVSMDGRHLLSTVPATGIGQTAVYPKPSVLTFIQSDQQGMWGRNCPRCERYFRTNHVTDNTYCPYCAAAAPSLAFISKDQRKYITAFYDAFARAFILNKSTSLELADITDQIPAWHYSEEKQQFHFTCDTKECRAQTDILGQYGYCPRCGRTNSRKLFAERIDKMLTRVEETKKTVSERKERGVIWEGMTVTSLSDFEALARHLRVRLLRFPLTPNRRKRLEELNFQIPAQANESLVQWFDIGVLEWAGNNSIPKRAVPTNDLPFIKKMIQKRHILMHNGGIVDQEYLDRSGDTGARLGERISIGSQDVKRFIGCVRAMADNLLDNVEYGFTED